MLVELHWLNCRLLQNMNSKWILSTIPIHFNIIKYMYERWAYVCQQLERISSAEKKPILNCFMFTLLWSQFSFSHSSIHVVAFAFLQFLLYIGTNDCTVNLHPWLQHTLIYVTYIVNVLHDKSDVNFPHLKKAHNGFSDVIYEEWKLIELELSVEPFVKYAHIIRSNFKLIQTPDGYPS